MSDEPSSPLDAQPVVTVTPIDTPLEEADSAPTTAQWPRPLRYGIGIVLIAICTAGLLLILPLLQILLLSFLIAFIMFIPSRALSRRMRLPYGLSVVVSFLIAAMIIIHDWPDSRYRPHLFHLADFRDGAHQRFCAIHRPG